VFIYVCIVCIYLHIHMPLMCVYECTYMFLSKYPSNIILSVAESVYEL